MFVEIKNLFAQTQNIFLGSMVAAVIIFFVQFAPAIFYVFGAETATPNDDVQKTFSQYLILALQKLSDLPHANAVIVGLFWAFAALLIYLSYLFVVNVLIATRNEIVIDTEEGTNQQKTKRLVFHIGGKILALLGFIIFASFALAFLWPYFINLLNIYVYSGMQSRDLGLLFAGIFGLSITIYLLVASAILVWKYEETT